eukprot:m.150177 g.150177  ORF g.150177 m.150177 type:complete len:553 (-) comp17370_c0_seq4:2308-3966(-)
MTPAKSAKNCCGSMSMLRLVVLGLCPWLCMSSGVPRPSMLSPEVTPWPKPLFASNGTEAIELDLATVVINYDHNSPILAAAVSWMRGWQVVDAPGAPAVQPKGVTTISITVVDASERLTDRTNESYVLNINAPVIDITAPTVFGALHALQSLFQMVEKTKHGVTMVRGTPWLIQDQPRFAHRGVLIDSARHFLPVDTIKDMIDGMAATKLNVLHWHLVDFQSFPFASNNTNLGRGAFSPSEMYSPDDVRSIVAYAKQWGVRVVAEIDTPGHTQSWGVAYPDIITECKGRNPPLDPTVNQTYEVIGELLGELNALFPDTFFHLGGDEVSYACWAESQRVAEFMKQRGWGKDYAKLQTYYESRLLQVAAAKLPKRQLVMYQEVFDYGVDIPKNVVIDVWKRANNHTVPPSPGLNEEVQRVVKAGFRAIVSNGPQGQWYLNYGFGNGLCTALYGCYYSLWTDVYANEPLAGTSLTPEEEKLVIGGEACLWGEEIDESNLMSKAFPRAAAFAERMWSARHVTDVTAAASRLARFYCKLRARGIQSSPLSPGSCHHW